MNQCPDNRCSFEHSKSQGFSHTELDGHRHFDPEAGGPPMTVGGFFARFAFFLAFGFVMWIVWGPK